MPRRELGINAGELWAYREGASQPLKRARIIDPGTHYDAHIRSVLIDEPGRPERSGRRPKYPCRWDRLEEYIAEQFEKGNRLPPTEPHRGPQVPHDLNVTVPELLALVTGRTTSPPIAYDVATAARTVGYSVSTLRAALDAGDLVARYANSKAIILHDELWEWAHGLPTSPPGRAMSRQEQ